jgi:DNA replication and repair protein RecF
MRERATLVEHAGATASRVYFALDQSETEDDPDLADTGDLENGGAEIGRSGGEGADAAGLQLVYRPSYDGPLDVSNAELISGMRARLHELRSREIAQGANVLGPHRDDLAFLSGGRDVSTYGSRGQQRSVALALKMAELDYIEHETGDQPILLLDDVLSELDVQRRADLLAAVRSLDQVLLTTADSTNLPKEARASAHMYRVRGGHVFELE